MTHAETTIAMMFVGVAVVMLAGAALGQVARRFREPPVVGEIIAGILLGPSLLGLFPGDLTSHLFPADTRPLLGAVAQFGLLPFMFVVGMHVETRLLKKQGPAAAAVSLSSIAFAFAVGFALAIPLYERHSTVDGNHVQFLAFAMFIGVAMSITAFPVLARILTHTGLIDTKIGTLALASAAIDDVVAWCLLTLVAAVATAGDAVSFLRVAGLSFAYVAFMLIVMRPLLRVQMRRWMRLSSPPPHAIAVVMAGLLLSAYMTTVIGIHPIFGAFLFGLVMPRDSAHGNPSTSQIHITSTSLAKFCEPFEQLGLLLLPVFFIVTGLGVDVVSLGMNGLMELVAIVTIACAGKLIGAAVPARLCGMTWSEAKTLGLLMNTRGLTELIVLNTGVSLGILDSQMFTMMVIMAVVTTSMAGPLIRHTPIELSKASDDTRQRPLVHADLA